MVLGMVPLARELVRRGASVALCCNTLPSINDVTAEEVAALLPELARADSVIDEAVRSGRLSVVSDGSDLPVIDLRRGSRALAEAATGADLVVLEGMGRAIETNLRAAFTVDSLKVGMIKHPEVAQSLGGRLYDCVCKFDSVTATRD